MAIVHVGETWKEAQTYFVIKLGKNIALADAPARWTTMFCDCKAPYEP